MMVADRGKRPWVGRYGGFAPVRSELRASFALDRLGSVWLMVTPDPGYPIWPSLGHTLPFRYCMAQVAVFLLRASFFFFQLRD